MKVSIEVKDRQERDALLAAMANPAARAQTLVAGILLQLPSDRARRAVLTFVADVLDEEHADGALRPL